MSYGGGDQLQTSNQIYARKMPFKIAEKQEVEEGVCFIRKEMIEKAYKSAKTRHEENERIDRNERVFHFPSVFPPLHHFSWQFVVNVSTQFYSDFESSYNLFFQGNKKIK